MTILRIKKRFQQSSMLIAIFLGSGIYLAAWAQGGKSVAPGGASPAAVPKATPAPAPSAMSSLKSAKSAPSGEAERPDLAIALTASGKQGQLGPIECLQYELHMLGARPGLAAKDQELKVTIKVDKTTPRFSAVAKTGELFQNVTLSNSAQTPAFHMKLTDAFVVAVSRSPVGDSKRDEELEVVTFKFAGLEVSPGNR